MTVRVLFQVDNINGTTNCTETEKRSWVRALNDKFMLEEPLGGSRRYYIGGGGSDTDPTLLYFKPGFNFSSNAQAIPSSNFILRVTHNTNGDINYTPTNGTVNIGRNLTSWHIRLFIFIFNKDLGSTNFSLSDLTSILNWHNSNVIEGNNLHAL